MTTRYHHYVTTPSQLTRMHGRMPSPTRKSRLYDVKLTFIPLLFLLLRISDLGLAIPHQYLSYGSRLQFRKTWWNAALVLIAVSSLMDSTYTMCVCVM